eukprot:3608925-Amphidinium_carterae.1
MPWPDQANSARQRSHSRGLKWADQSGEEEAGAPSRSRQMVESAWKPTEEAVAGMLMSTPAGPPTWTLSGPRCLRLGFPQSTLTRSGRSWRRISGNLRRSRTERLNGTSRHRTAFTVERRKPALRATLRMDPAWPCGGNLEVPLTVLADFFPADPN